MIYISRLLKSFVHKFGYDIVRYSVKNRGDNPYLDMAHFVSNRNPIIFDIGANLGESLESFKAVFPFALLHCFEPSTKAFSTLTKKYNNSKDIFLYSDAFGSEIRSQWFFDNEFPYMSSFLELGPYGYGNVINKRLITTNTLDNFAGSAGFKSIDIVKIDTQGFEYNVLLGGSELLASGKIKLIHVELTFTEMYLNLPSYRLILEYLHEHEFVLCGIYRQHFQNGYLSWADALFVRRS